MKKILPTILLLLLLGASGAFAADAQQANINIDEARIALQKLMDTPDVSIPHGLIKNAKAVIIVPSLLKGGFILGASAGNGVALIRRPDGKMGPPVFFNAGGASVGLQIGGQSSDLVLVVASERGLQGLLKNEMTIGSDLSVAAGPVGRSARAAVSGASTDADLYSYSSTVGLFAGISLDGTGLSYDRATTSAYYGRDLSLADVYKPGAVTVPASGQQLMKVVNQHVNAGQ